MGENEASKTESGGAGGGKSGSALNFPNMEWPKRIKVRLFR